MKNHWSKTVALKIFSQVHLPYPFSFSVGKKNLVVPRKVQYRRKFEECYVFIFLSNEGLGDS